jgi:hypothetical protein
LGVLVHFRAYRDKKVVGVFVTAFSVRRFNVSIAN